MKGFSAGVDTDAITLSWMRAMKVDHVASTHKVWRSRCGKYRVVESVSKYGLSTVYYAQRLVHLGTADSPSDESVFAIISRHKTKAGAQKACCQHASQPRRRA